MSEVVCVDARPILKQSVIMHVHIGSISDAKDDKGHSFKVIVPQCLPYVWTAVSLPSNPLTL